MKICSNLHLYEIGDRNSRNITIAVENATNDLLFRGYECQAIAACWLSAGALNVVSTLWAVDDCATALFSILYYEQRRQQPTLERSEALRRAQRQLRNLTGQKFNAKYRAPLEAYLRQIGKNDDLKKYCNLQHPFESPRYWAAFVSQGMN